MQPSLDQLESLLPSAMIADRHRLRQRLAGLRRSAEPSREALAAVAAVIARSIERRRQRGASAPRPVFSQDLPILAARAEIADAIANNQVVVICGQTGSGKSTQLPQICLDLGRGQAGFIGHTQPRRIAARTLAARIADELQATVGQAVGYKIRFGDHVSESTLIKLMTDGILLAETQSDPLLEQYDTLIVDEAHERSLNIDFLLGYLRRILPRRPDLKLIITSATIDPQRFSRHFGDAPIIEVSGRTFSIEMLYRPLESGGDDDALDQQMTDAIAAAVDELWHPPRAPGDILIFLPGEWEIRQVAQVLRERHPTGAEILPLYARLSADEQNRVFAPHRRPRIVLATNVAETSLTVPGIHFVIDPGLARLSRYSPRSGVQRLPIEKISQASADQRRGRCGRVASGVCIRLYSEEDFQARPIFTDPEIYRTNLASVILRMKALNLGRPEDFPFIDPPDYRAIKDAYQTLFELHAVDEHNELTPAGRSMARLPIDVRIARMILAAMDEGVIDDVLIIASALSVQDPRQRPLDQQDQADRAHEQFRDEQSDFLTYLHLWQAFEEQSRRLSGSKLRAWCRDHFLSFVHLREWREVHRQLAELVHEMQPSRRSGGRRRILPQMKTDGRR
ncbi:MAG TPA: ATP-dependent RNA helicase HrpA [Tepidisphaeraceae bacterium]|jgi:ATP-dependent helicase HrpA|nr:ATP-dependent RNA helicase HrpA [Tepidisphaeraceae bacterium]